jgi:anti-sigma B factor antagonist
LLKESLFTRSSEIAPAIGLNVGMPPVELAVSETVSDGRCTLHVDGELDMASAGRLETAVALALGGAPRELVLDLRGVRFMDSTGLRAVLRARKACDDSDSDFFVLPAERSRQHRLFQVSGLIGILTFREPDAAAGQAAAQAG